MPPNRDDWCRYVAAWVVIKARWELSMDESEYGRVRNLLNGECEGLTTAGGVPTRPTSGPTPPTTIGTTATTEASGSSAVRITNIVYDAPGNDVEYNNSEYVALKNTSNTTIDVGGWRLVDLKDHTITIPSGYMIPGGETLRVYSGPGDSNSSRYFAGLGQAIWNNSGGDTAFLYDASSRLVDDFSYSS
jgi:hypothetical protein